MFILMCIFKIMMHILRSFAPMPDEYGVDLAPNTASSIAVQLNDITRMAAPYKTNCTARWSDTGLEVDDANVYSLAVTTFNNNLFQLLFFLVHRYQEQTRVPSETR